MASTDAPATETLIPAETAKILKHRGTSSPEHLNTLFGKCPVTVGEITDRSLGAVCETHRNQHVVTAVTI